MARHPRRSAMRKIRESPALDARLRQIRRHAPTHYNRLIKRIVRAAWLSGDDDNLFWGPPVENPQRHAFCEAPWRGYHDDPLKVLEALVCDWARRL